MSDCMIDTEVDHEAHAKAWQDNYDGMYARWAECDAERLRLKDELELASIKLRGTLPDAEADGYSWGPVLADGAYAEAQTITEAAQSAVYGDRGDDYGHPRQDWNRQALIWTALLQPKLAEGEFITPEDVGRCMIGVKLARDVHSPIRDNRVDIAGYALCLERLVTGQ